MGVGRKARRSGRTGHGTGKTVWGLLVFQTARMALLVALVSILAFVLLSVSPVDPLQTNVGQAALGAMSPEQVERLKGYWGVDTASGRAVSFLGGGCSERRYGAPPFCIGDQWRR